jgi:hypothetical protein
MTQLVDPQLYDALRVVLLLGLALLAFRELRAIRAQMKRDKDQLRKRDQPPVDGDPKS